MDVLFPPLRSHGLWQSGLWPLGNVCKSVRPVGDAILSAEGSQERECLVDAFVQHLSLGMKSLSAKASQERGCLVGAFAQPRVVAEWALAAWECLQKRECLVRGFEQPPVMAEWVVAVWGDILVCRMFAKSVNILLAP